MKKIHEAYIGIGSNINPEENIEKSLNLLKKHVKLMDISSFYWTKPLLNKDQPDYLNGVVKIETSLNPMILKNSVLKRIENKLGRQKTIDKYSSRTIDLDLILYDDQIIDNSDLYIPDPDIYSRIFLAIPLYELNPGLILPDTGMSIVDIIKKFEISDMKKDIVFSNKFKNFVKSIK